MLASSMNTLIPKKGESQSPRSEIRFVPNYLDDSNGKKKGWMSSNDPKGGSFLALALEALIENSQLRTCFGPCRQQTCEFLHV
jgi:hypothetical protein